MSMLKYGFHSPQRSAPSAGCRQLCRGPVPEAAGSQRRFAWLALLGTALLIGSLAGCRDRGGEAMADSEAVAQRRVLAAGEPAAGDATITVNDRLGRSVSFTQAPQRIVSLTPSMTEVLFGVGAGDRIVGATSHCDYPAGAKEIPRVGGGTLESLNQELIVSLQPDLVLCKWDKYEPLLRNLERLNIPVLALGPESLAQLYDETRLLGAVIGNHSQAAAMIAAMQARVAAVVDRIPEGDRPKVFYQVWDDPLTTAGGNSFIGELLNLAGAINLFDGSPIRYPKVNPEVVVAADPDVILAPASHATPVNIDSILSRPGWSEVRAIRRRRVHLLDRDTISRCGPRLVDALEEMVSLLYPDRFPAAGLATERSGGEATGSAASEDPAP
jgi:iron complex transport system substrate-binding protein